MKSYHADSGVGRVNLEQSLRLAADHYWSSRSLPALMSIKKATTGLPARLHHMFAARAASSNAFIAIR